MLSKSDQFLTIAIYKSEAKVI